MRVIGDRSQISEDVFDFMISHLPFPQSQSVLNLLNVFPSVYMSIRSQMSLIMGQVIPDQSVLSAIEIEKLNFSSLFGIYLLC